MMKRILIICVVLALLVVFFAGSTVVSAKEEETGFVQCYTKASINFEEAIEFTLTNKETGETITKRLYWINEYEGNFSVPFGAYAVSAKVVVESGFGGGYYEVICSPEEITVNKTNLAEVLGFRVEEIAAGDVSDGSWSDPALDTDSPDDTSGSVTPDVPTDNSGEGSQAGRDDVSGSEENQPTSGNDNEVHPIIGIVVSVVVLLIIGAIVFYVMWRRENPDLD